ncbi:MAG: hypothetical protein EA376_00145 [Phycisphaeraceae bacterium]|nr:MAG: hypothetical protein EA376_00145 [Phycisphaeraceae bacterium]
MIETELLTSFTQFGVAGLMALLWLSERRHASARERQLTEAHERLREQRVQLGQLLEVVQANTRAMTALEEGQRRLAELLGSLARSDRRLRLRRDGDEAG